MARRITAHLIAVAVDLRARVAMVVDEIAIHLTNHGIKCVENLALLKSYENRESSTF